MRDDVSDGFTQMLLCRTRVCHPVGLYRLTTLQAASAFHSSLDIHLLPEWGIRFSWQMDMSIPNCVWYVQSQAGSRLQRWTYEPVFLGRRAFDMGKNCASHTSHIEQMKVTSPYGHWVLWKLLLTTKLNIRMSVPLQLIHSNRGIYVNSLTGNKGVIYQHAVSCIHICRIRPSRHTASFIALHVAKSQSDVN